MTKEEQIKELYSNIAWLKELIEDALKDPHLDEEGKAWLRNLIKYYERDRIELMRLLEEE